MQLDKMDGVGLQMTHSMDSYVAPSFVRLPSASEAYRTG